MTENLEYLYRYRPINKLFEYKELENLSIYFAKPNELNDQMEDYMNIVWQGDEIAFQGLFKHYLYTLSHLYYIASLVNRGEHLDIEHLPIFMSIDLLEAPEIKTIFKDIYFEFFSSESISNIPTKMANSNKKFTADEILLILKSIHMYAYLVINTQIKKYIRGEDSLAEKEYNEIYNSVKYWQSYDIIINTLISEQYKKEFLLSLIDSQDMQREQIKIGLDKTHLSTDNFNINVLTFDYPELYIKQIKKILYNNFCVTCFSATYRNEPMWSHYADSENGICLKFKVKNKDNSNYINLYTVTGITSNSKGTRVNKGYYDNPIYKVKYADEYPEIDFFSSLGCLPHPIIDGFWLCNYDQTKFSNCCEKYKNMDEWRKNYHKKAEEYICTKAKSWEYEQEYRIFQREMMHPTYDDVENRIAKYNLEDLEAIIFGRNVSANDKQRIIEIVNKQRKEKSLTGLKFYDLYYSTITKQLEIKKCREYATVLANEALNSYKQIK